MQPCRRVGPPVPNGLASGRLGFLRCGVGNKWEELYIYKILCVYLKWRQALFTEASRLDYYLNRVVHRFNQCEWIRGQALHISFRMVVSKLFQVQRKKRLNNGRESSTCNRQTSQFLLMFQASGLISGRIGQPPCVLKLASPEINILFSNFKIPVFSPSRNTHKKKNQFSGAFPVGNG